ncbi:MAG: zf-HC2 domain-containing protein, partial [Pirellulales bacterium]
MQLDPRDQERLSAYLDGELSADEQARVEQLLADEPAARQLLDELRAVSTTLQSLPRAPVPGDLAADVLREIEARGVRRGPKPGPGGGAGSAASDKSRALEATIAEATDNTITDSKDDPSDAQRSADSRKAAVSTAATPLSKSIAARDDRDGRHNQPLTWRQRIVRPLVYAGIAVAVFAAVSLMTEPVADDPVHVARQLEEDVQPDEAGGAAETWDMAERGRDGAIAAKDGGRRRSQVRSEGQTAGPAATAGPSDNVVDQSAPAAANGMVLSKPGAMPAQAGAEVHGVGGAAAPVHAPDPRMFYIQQALVNQEPVLVVQCRVTPEAARKDLVGKLLAKNHVAIDDEAAAELDTAINSNIFPSLATQQAVPGAALAPQLAMPAQARPGVAAPSPPSVAAGEEPLPRRQDTDRKVAKQAPADGDADSPGNEPAELADTPAEPSPDATVYLVDASPVQLEAVLSELNSQTDEVLSVAVSPAPETPAQSDYLSYNRAGPRVPAAESSPDAVG